MFRFLQLFYERTAFNSLVTGNFTEAEKIFLKIREKYPEKNGINYNLGVSRIGLGKYQDAEKDILKDIEKYGKSFSKLRTIGDLYYIWGKRAEANTNYTEALLLAENDNDKKYLDQRIKNTSNISLFDKVLISHNHFEKGNRFLEAYEFDNALEEYILASKNDSTNFQALNNIGTILMNNKKEYQTAADYFRKALEIIELPVIRSNLNQVLKLISN